ncbi:MAG: 23S rRNA (adenine(2503)-C(2))-methyltransferase RlmN, partial [Planctomycetota bacterium]|nr:23S rRNA (adenine(2503)-C(2))-methyltransferase RlmN [Planctomycetota bacterium]
RDWLHAKRVGDFAAMQNLPAAVRERLAADRALRALRPVERRAAADGLTAKWLFAAGEDERDLIECVLIIEKERRRRTVCVSCMIGCPLACAFCATGKYGYVRDLSAGEIIEQAYVMDGALREDGGDGVSHVVFMGMGEPLLNYDAVLRAADVFADPDGMGLSGRHVTISTVGIPDGIVRLAESGRNYRLAVSLHAPNQAIRERILPAAKRWPLDRLFPAIERFAAVSSRDVTFEYCLIDGVNAAEQHARELASLIGGFRAKVNLIPMNAVDGAGLRAPSAAATRRFQEILEARGIAAPVRMEKGADIGGACGQLRAERVRI